MSRKTKKKVARRVAASKPEPAAGQPDQGFSVVVAVLSLGCFVIPLTASTTVNWPFSLPKLAVVGLLAFAALLAWCLETSRSAAAPRFSWALIPIGGLALWTGLASITSVNPATSVLGKYGRYDGLLTLGSYLAIAWAGFQHRWNRREVDVLALAVVSSAVLVSAYAVLQFLGIDPISWGTVQFESNRAFSTFGNPALLSGYLALTLFVAVGLALRGKQPELSLAAAALIGLALFTTLTRGGWIAGILGLVVLGVLLARLGRFRSIVVYSLATLAVVAVIAAGLSLYSSARPGAVSPMERLNSALLTSGTAAERIEIWKAAAGAVSARPLFGWGPDNFRVAFARHETKAYVSRLGGGRLEDNAHNYPLQLAATAGIPAALLFVLAFAWTVVLGIRRAVATRDFLLLGVVTGLIAYFVNILFTVNVVGSAFLFWLLIGVVLSIANDDERAPAELDSARRAILWVASLAVGLVLIIPPLVEFSADHVFNRAGVTASDSSLEAALPDYDRAFAMNPWVDRYRFQLGSAYFRSGLRTGVPADYALAARQFQAARLINPYEVDNLLFLAQVNIFAWERHAGGDPSQAVRNLDELMRLQPLSPSALYLRALIYRDRGDDRRATILLEQALRLYPDYSDARELLSVIKQH